MTPIPSNPTVVLLVNVHGAITRVANNIAPDLKVVLTQTNEEFDGEACNRPFSVSLPDTSPVNRDN